MREVGRGRREEKRLFLQVENFKKGKSKKKNTIYYFLRSTRDNSDLYGETYKGRIIKFTNRQKGFRYNHNKFFYQNKFFFFVINKEECEFRNSDGEKKIIFYFMFIYLFLFLRNKIEADEPGECELSCPSFKDSRVC